MEMIAMSGDFDDQTEGCKRLRKLIRKLKRN